MISNYEKDNKGWTHLTGAQVTCVPILVPNRKIRKMRLVFIVLADGKELTCVVWGKFALAMAKLLHVGRTVHVYGKEKGVFGRPNTRPNLHVHTMTIPRSLGHKDDAVYKVDKSKVWDILLKVPVVSRWVPEAMRV